MSQLGPRQTGPVHRRPRQAHFSTSRAARFCGKKLEMRSSRAHASLLGFAHANAGKRRGISGRRASAGSLGLGRARCSSALSDGRRPWSRSARSAPHQPGPAGPGALSPEFDCSPGEAWPRVANHGGGASSCTVFPEFCTACERARRPAGRGMGTHGERSSRPGALPRRDARLEASPPPAPPGKQRPAAGCATRGDGGFTAAGSAPAADSCPPPPRSHPHLPAQKPRGTNGPSTLFGINSGLRSG